MIREETSNGYLLTCISRDNKLIKFVSLVGDFLRKQWESGIPDG